MKKLLTIFFVGIFTLVSCSKTIYKPFLKETLQPQLVVDSLLGDYSTDFLEWYSYDVLGVRNTDSCTITTYYFWSPVKGNRLRNTSVITYSITDTATVKSRVLYK